MLLTIFSIFALNVLTPGANFVLILRNSLAHGRQTGIWLALGLASVDIIFAVAAMLGLSALMSAHAGIGQVIACLGGFWLSYLGLKMLKERKGVELSDTADQCKGNLPRYTAYKLGLSGGLINPQAIVFFSSVFLGSMDNAPTIKEIVMLLVGIAAISAFIRCGVATVVALPTIRSVYLANRRKMETLSGGALVLLGLKLSVKSVLPVALKLAAVASGALHFA